MIGPNRAFVLASLAFPEVNFTWDCVDYDGFWGLPYNDTDGNVANRIFVSKNTGIVIPNDPSFDVVKWNKSKNVKDNLDIEKIERILSMIRFLMGKKL